VNGLAERDDVFDIVTSATYLVVGLGDVYLGAPVAVPLDPRHRLVTTKYDPARTWTPENAVGIGGIYLCIYGMEGPGGYQLVGRTVPVWRLTGDDESPWMLRLFDRLRFEPVSAEELLERRVDIAAGRQSLETTATTFCLADAVQVTDGHAAEVSEFLARRDASFGAERARWVAGTSAANA
jgi:urea carboxylase